MEPEIDITEIKQKELQETEGRRKMREIKYFPTYFTPEFIKGLKFCSSEQKDLFEIVYQIQFMAAIGAKEACFYKKPVEEIVLELIKRGFIITPSTSKELRENGLYYTISW